MKNIIFLFSIIACVILVSSCATETSCLTCDFTCITDFTNQVFDNNCKNKYECDKEIFLDKAIDIDLPDPMIEKVGSMVINFHSFKKGSPNISDDSYSYDLLMELDESTEIFSHAGEDLSALNLISESVCFCPDTEYMNVTEGCMQGEKIDGIWYLQGSLTIPNYGGLYEFDISIP